MNTKISTILILETADKLKIPGFQDLSQEDFSFEDFSNRFVAILPKHLLKKPLNFLTVEDVCNLLDEVDKVFETTLGKHKHTIQQQNIKGRVLLVCNLDELREVMGMNFGDWEIFRLMILELRFLESRRTSLNNYHESDDSVDSSIRSTSSIVRRSTSLKHIKFDKHVESKPRTSSAINEIFGVLNASLNKIFSKQDPVEPSTVGAQQSSLPSISLKDGTQSSMAQTQDSGYPSSDKTQAIATQTSTLTVTLPPSLDDEILGNITGQVTGEVMGHVTGRMLGRVNSYGTRGKGRVYGKIAGTLSGRLSGTMEGAVHKRRQSVPKKN